MVEPIVPIETKPMTRLQRNAFFVLIGGTIIISLVLVSVAVSLYVTNGTEQLDLSRPGYQEVGKQAYKAQDVAPFSESGSLDQSVIDDFLDTYDGEAEKVTKAPSYSGDPIGDMIDLNK